MALDLGEGPVAVPPALRGHRPAWRDPRLWVGVVLVTASVLLGARLLAAADDTVQVWAARRDLGAGERVEADDLVAERVHFVDAAEQGGYLLASTTVPDDVALTRGVGAGELLPRAALGTGRSGLAELPVAVDPDLVPPGVGPGDVVDVYLLASQGSSTGPALAGVTVLDAPDPATSFATTGRRQLVLAVPDADVASYFALLATNDDPQLTVVRRG